MSRVLIRFLVGFLLVLTGAPLIAAAADGPESGVRVQPTFTSEAWGGADATAHSWSVYGGLTTSLWSDIRTDGFRLRSAGGYGTYTYTSPRWDGVTRSPKQFDGVQSYADLFVGYQKTLGSWTLKGFIGASQQRHDIVPFDVENIVQGSKIAVKGALETWLSIGETAFLQTDMSYSDAFKSYGARLRAGYRLTPALSTGLEAAAIGNANYDAGRGGAFVRFEWSQGEVSVSGGAAGDQSGVTGGYGSFNLLFRF